MMIVFQAKTARNGQPNLRNYSPKSTQPSTSFSRPWTVRGGQQTSGSCSNFSLFGSASSLSTQVWFSGSLQINMAWQNPSYLPIFLYRCHKFHDWLVVRQEPLEQNYWGVCQVNHRQQGPPDAFLLQLGELRHHSLRVSFFNASPAHEPLYERKLLSRCVIIRGFIYHFCKNSREK